MPMPNCYFLSFRPYIIYLGINPDTLWVIQTLNSSKSRTTIATLARFTASASRFLLDNRSWLSASPPCAYELLGGGGGWAWVIQDADVGVGFGTSILDSAVAGCLMLTGEDAGAADIPLSDVWGWIRRFEWFVWFVSGVVLARGKLSLGVANWASES